MTSEDNNFQELLDKLFPDEPSSGSDDDVSSPEPDQYTDWKRRRRTIVPKPRIPPLELQPTKEEEPSKPSPAPKTPEKQVHWTKNLAAPPAPKKPRPAVIVVRHPPTVPPPPPPPAPAAAAAVPTIQAEEEDDWEPYTQPCPAGGWLAPLPPPPPARAAAAIDDDADDFAPAPSPKKPQPPAKKPRLQEEEQPQEQQQQEQQQELPNLAIQLASPNDNRVIELHHNDNSVIELHIQILQGRGRSADFPIDLTH